MNTFKKTSLENKTFIQAVAKNEVGFDFTFDQLDILLGNETDEFIVNPLARYKPSAIPKLDSYDQGVIAALIFEKLTGISIGLPIHQSIDEIMSHDDWADKLYSRKAMHKFYNSREEVVEYLSISTGEFPDHLKLISSKKYSKVFIDFLLEHKDELRKRLEASELD